MIKVILCDDHALIRRGIRDTLSDAPDIEVIGEAGDATVALSEIARRYPRLELDGPPERDPRVRFRGFRRLPARLG